MKESAESYGQNVYTPNSRFSLIKFNNFFIKNSYTEEFRDFLGNEKFRWEIITSARIHPSSKKYKINIGCFDGKRISARDVREKNLSMFISIIQLCSIWISKGTIFKEAIEELKLNFKVFDNVICDKNVKSFVKTNMLL